ncbi:MAG: hypothetical protein JNK82_18360 [Myxococcaceae bacterium]|nr:hypothetical protein [Myxococcaceae bacterium]
MSFEALWQRVHSSPYDAEARRVLADALLEAGDPRGELIVVQSQLAEVDEDERDPVLRRLAERERELLDAHGAEWVKGWPFELWPHFARGFPQRQLAPVTQMVKGLARAMDLAPTLNELQFTDEDPRVWAAGFRQFAAEHRGLSLHELTLPITFSPGDVAALVQLQVEALTFTGGALNGLSELLQLPLKELALEFEMGVRVMPNAMPLRVLINRGNEVPSVPDAPALERLTLDRVHTRVAPARYPLLRRLELLDTALGKKPLLALLQAGHPLVRRLGLRGEKLDVELMAALERWPSLEVLDVRGCTVAARALDLAVVRRLKLVLR